MLSFFSDENIEIHKSFERVKKMRYSILEKSIIGIKGKNISEISGQKLKKRDKNDVLLLLSDISLHTIFFASFADNTFTSSDAVRASFGSEASFLNELFVRCMEIDHGFVCVYNINGKISVGGGTDLQRLCLPYLPDLSIDVCEHAYFLDYGFDKERYLRAALPYLDIAKLS